MNYFQALNAIDVNDKTEKKNGLTYLSWAWAWGELKKAYPESYYTIYENQDGWFYHTDGKTCWVKTGVTLVYQEKDHQRAVEHVEYLPVMDFRNKSIPAEAVTSFDVNKAIQRSLTKAVARHGLGLYIYAGEDLPESADEAAEKKAPPTRNDRISKLCAHHKIGRGTFDSYMKTLQDEGKVARTTPQKMTDDEFIKLLGQVHEALQQTKEKPA